MNWSPAGRNCAHTHTRGLPSPTWVPSHLGTTNHHLTWWKLGRTRLLQLKAFPIVPHMTNTSCLDTQNINCSKSNANRTRPEGPGTHTTYTSYPDDVQLHQISKCQSHTTSLSSPTQTWDPGMLNPHTATMSSPLDHKFPASSQPHTTWCRVRRRITRTCLPHNWPYRFKQTQFGDCTKNDQNTSFFPVCLPKTLPNPFFFPEKWALKLEIWPQKPRKIVLLFFAFKTMK